MAREIVSKKDLKASKTFAPIEASPAADGYMDRLVKYIPAEVIAVYMTAINSCEAATDTTGKGWLLWVVFGVIGVLAILYLVRVLKIKKPIQIAVMLVAYGIWAFAMGGPFEGIPGRELISAISVPIYTFLIAIIEA